MTSALRSILVVLPALVALAGCVVDGTLDPSGGGRLRLRYRLVSVAHFEPNKARLQSPDVILAGASMTPDKWATFELTTADVRTLSTAPSLAGTSVALTDESDGSRTLAVTVSSLAKDLPAQYLAYLGGEFRLTVELPGRVVRSNATAVTGRSVTWARPLADLVGESSLTFTATYAPAP